MFRAITALAMSFFLSTSFTFAQVPADSRIKKITASKSLKIAYRTDATPFSFLNNQKEPAGYTIDLCKLVAASIEKQIGVQGLKIEWVPVTTQSRFDAIISGKADMECGSSTITLSRMKQIDFSSIVFVETTGLVVKSDSGINSAADLAGKKIAVVGGTTNQQALTALQRDGILNATLVTVKDRSEGIAALGSGAADAFASDKLLLLGADVRGAAFKLLADDLSFEPYGIVLPRGDWAFRLAVNTGLSQIYRSGQVLEIFRRWFEQIGLQPVGVMAAAYRLGGLPD